MCAIAGLYAFAPSAPPADRAELRTIRDPMSARGPDSLGEWFSPDGRVAFGHRRLAIIDLSEGGAQPMASADGQLVITFNGEIYNYRELRRELEAQGHVFRTESDTEVLLHLYQAKGTAMLQDLRGTQGDALDAIGAAVRSSIAAHHVADVPVGMFLSAGIDSALITALSSAHGERPHTLTLAFAETMGSANDESPLAEQLAQAPRRRAELSLRAKRGNPCRRFQAFNVVPSIDGVNTWFVSQAAASQGIKVALSGLGGDELFASYPSFADLPCIRRPAVNEPNLRQHRSTP